MLWRGPGGAQEVLLISYPLILSNMSYTVQTFVDRLFLTWYSPEAVAGAVTALIASWVVIGLFLGTGEYLTTFVAQYFGAGRLDRIGPAMWQGIYFAILAGFVVAAFVPLIGPVFALAGHAPEVHACEVTYGSIIMLGAFPAVLMATLSTFFAGRGQTLTVLIVNIIVTLTNVVLDYAWIFGHFGFPRGGVKGAALATVTSQVIGATLYFLLMMRPRHRRTCHTADGWRLEPALLYRLLRFGLPTGLQYTGEILAFAIFMILIGRLGTAPLAATGISFNLNMIVFMPMIGLGIGVSSLVGRYLGRNEPATAERATWTAFRMSFAYMLLCGALYVFAPHALLAPYAAGADAQAFASVGAIAAILLRFVALYSIFDMMNIIFASALRGAGDTVFPFVACVSLSWGVMLLPVYVSCVRLGQGIFVAWTMITLYVMLLGSLMLRRFRQGRWKTMRVIEQAAPPDLDAEPAQVIPEV